MGRTISTLNDLAQLPDSELIACLSGIRAAIHKAKRAYASSQNAGRKEAAPFTFTSYEWRPRQSTRSSPRPRPDMPIDELGLRVSISSALKEIGICYVEDLSEADEDELLKHEAIGVRTTARLRDVLQQASLSFREPATDQAVRAKGIAPSPRVATAWSARGV